MNIVRVNRNKLLEVVRSNRTKHIDEYNAAVVGYKKDVIKKIEEIISDLKNKIDKLKGGALIELDYISFDLPAPKSHEIDYDQQISMLEMSVDAVIELNYQEYQNYVMDKWTWTENFKLTASKYIKNHK